MNVTQPRVGVPIGIVTIQGKSLEVVPHPEYVRFFESMKDRVGGTSGPGTIDLTISQFEDAGIEEMKARISQIQDEVRQLPIPAEVSSSGGASWTELEIDFGSTPVYEASFTITDAGIAAASKVQVLPCGKAATGRTADDWQWDGATFAANPGSGSATCYAVFVPGPIVGRRTVQYSVST